MRLGAAIVFTGLAWLAVAIGAAAWGAAAWVVLLITLVAGLAIGFGGSSFLLDWSEQHFHDEESWR